MGMREGEHLKRSNADKTARRGFVKKRNAGRRIDGTSHET